MEDTGWKPRATVRTDHGQVARATERVDHGQDARATTERLCMLLFPPCRPHVGERGLGANWVRFAREGLEAGERGLRKGGIATDGPGWERVKCGMGLV